MHFLGLAGMPRRISDYPDIFASVNLLSSYGSFLTFAGLLLFFWLLFLAFFGEHLVWISKLYYLFEKDLFRKKKKVTFNVFKVTNTARNLLFEKIKLKK